MESELKNIRWDIGGDSQVRWRRDGLENQKSGHLFYYHGEQHESVGGVGFFIKSQNGTISLHYSSIWHS